MAYHTYSWNIICYQWFKQQLLLSASESSISQQSQFKEDTVEPSVPVRDFNLKAFAAINVIQMIRQAGLWT